MRLLFIDFCPSNEEITSLYLFTEISIQRFRDLDLPWNVRCCRTFLPNYYINDDSKWYNGSFYCPPQLLIHANFGIHFPSIKTSATIDMTMKWNALEHLQSLKIITSGPTNKVFNGSFLNT